MSAALAVFLRAPRAGQVKTRLAAEIGERHALRLYRIMAARTLAAAAEAVDPGQGWLAVGADCPRLDAPLLREAAGAIGEGLVVLGPTLDGGYYLVGGRAPLPDIFSEMPWSTERLLEATRARLAGAGVPWRELRMLRDVDTAEDARAEGLLT